MKRKHSIAWLLVLLLGIGSICHAVTGVQDLSTSNFRLFSAPSPASDMVLQDLRGRQVSLSGLRGKAVILNFWKIDCPPCSAEKPILERIYRKYAGRGLEIVAVNLSDPPEQLQTYAQRGAFSFTIAYDAFSRFSLKRETIGRGMQTTVVVNPNSEAIYEVPGVPTTYLIDRAGRVVGNSVGMVNWEDPAMSSFLESFLEPTVRTAALEPNATNARAALTEATRTPNRSPESVRPEVRFAAAESPLDSPSDFPRQGPYPATTAQQGFSSPAAPVDSPVQLQRPPQTNPRNQQQPATRKPATAAPKPKPEAAAKPGKPGAPVQTGTGTVNQDPSGYPPIQPFQSSTTTTQTNPGQGGLQPLPPAMPYTPPRGQVRTAPIVPDDNGTVTARIPGMVGGSNLPAAQQVNGPNPIGGFILDSFGPASGPPRQPPRPISVQRPQIEEPAQQPANIIQQIGQDFQSLGAGIKDTFSRILPGR